MFQESSNEIKLSDSNSGLSFIELSKALNKFNIPFTEPLYGDNNITTQEVKNNIVTIVDNLDNL